MARPLQPSTAQLGSERSSYTLQRTSGGDLELRVAVMPGDGAREIDPRDLVP